MQASPVFSRPDSSITQGLADSEFVWHTRELPGTETNPVIARRFSDEVLVGLCQTAKEISPIWRYDEAGAALAEEVSARPEYYLARKEADILKMNRPLLREVLCHASGVIEIGNGRNTTTSLLLDAMDQPSSYVPINISSAVLQQSVSIMRNCFPEMECLPHHADYRMPMTLPANAGERGQLVAYCPGSSIASLMPLESVVCMQRIRQLLGPDGVLIIGQDTTRIPNVLLPAYDDAGGVSAAFNRNVLARINNELAGSFDLALFHHEARFNHRLGRIETHLISTASQWVEISDRAVHFEAGESIHTGNAYKYPAEEFLALAQSAGWNSLHTWTDRDSRFAVHVLSASPQTH